jgi:hypothetical protein
MWSSGQHFRLQTQWSRVRFPVLSDFLRNGTSGTGFTKPREAEEILERRSSGSGLENRD